MNITLQEFIVWLVVGGLVGSWVGMLVKFEKKGFGRLRNTGIGMLGALIGGLLFKLFRIDLGLGELKVTFEQIVSAFAGSLLLLFVLWVVRLFRGKRTAARAE